MHTPFLLLFFFSPANFSSSWPLPFLPLLLHVQTMPLCCCSHHKSHVILSVGVQTGILCSPMLACLPARWKGSILCSEDTENLSGLLHTFASSASFPCEAEKQAPEEAKIDFLQIIVLLSVLLDSLKLQSQNQYCRSCSKDIMIRNIHNKVSYCWELQPWKYYTECKLVH